MLGLFRYRYDYYEWEDLIAVSECYKKLMDKFNDVNNDSDILCVVTEDLHNELANQEERHYMIKEVELL